MGILNAIVAMIRALFSRDRPAPETSSRPPVAPNMPPPPRQPLDSHPFPVSPPPVGTLPSSPTAARRQPNDLIETPCTLKVNDDVGTAHVRSGPGLPFEVVTRTQGGKSFVVLGVSAPDSDGFAWYLVDLPELDGWIRSDLITLGPGCHGLMVIRGSGTAPTSSPAFNTAPGEPDADAEPETTGEASDLMDALCRATIKSHVITARIRSGPGTSFAVIERAASGRVFGIGGISGLDSEGMRWYWIDLLNGGGWVRGDLIELSGLCEELQIIQPPEAEPPQPPPPRNPGVLFALPTLHRVIQGFHNNHQAYDIDAPEGTTFFAPTRGVVIREVHCQHCTEKRHNIRPSTLDLVRRNQIFSDPAWGFGYGNFITLRYDYVDMPRPLQQKMDEADLTDQFAYVLYGHLGHMAVTNGQIVEAGMILGETGNTGYSSGPHLHIEVKIGRDAQVEGRWRQQITVHPNLMFRDNSVLNLRHFR